MSYAENLLVAKDFVETGWSETPRTRVVQEIISFFNETHRFTDTYTFFYDEGGFYVLINDEETNQSKKIYVRNAIERRSYLGGVEGEIFDNLESWFDQNDEGGALWISPPYPEKHRGWKIILHQIAYAPDGSKVLLNGADLFEAPDKIVFSLIHGLFPETKDINTPEEMRSLFMTLDTTFDPSNLFEKIKEIDPKALAINQKLDGEELLERATYISELIYSGANSAFVAYEMQRLGLVGEHQVSCAGGGKTLSELIVGGLEMEDQYGSLEFTCPKCGGINSRPFGHLVSNCKHCGANVSC